MRLYLPKRRHTVDVELCMLDECSKVEHKVLIRQLVTNINLPAAYKQQRTQRHAGKGNRGRDIRLNHTYIKDKLFQSGHQHKVRGDKAEDYLKLEATFRRRIKDQAMILIVLVEHYMGKDHFYAYATSLGTLVKIGETL